MHPFKDGKRLLGPYWYGDGKYAWDRDTWKYVVKYHLTLPEEFIEHVMSDAGTQFLEKAYCKADSWYQKVEGLEGDNKHMNFLPKDADDIDIEEF